MKKQMIKMSVLLTVTTMLLAGCGGTEDTSVETEMSVVENGVLKHEDVANKDASKRMQDESETDTTDVIVAATELEENKAEEIQNPQDSEDQEKPEEPQEPVKPQEPEEPKKPAHEHKYTSVVTKEPTCAGLHGHGERLYTCGCGDSYTEVIYCKPCEGDGIMVVVQEPDCQHCGIKLDHCKWCGRQMIGHEIPKTEHVPFDHYSKVNGYWVLWCRDCGYVVDVIPVEESPEEPQRIANMENSFMKIFLYNER